MADIVGVDGIHNIKGLQCDFCGKECDSKVEELNFLTCSFRDCPQEASMYHQSCIEKFLKRVGCERNRKTGFDCPRGKGKGTEYSAPCNGKIQKSHPVHIRNDTCANRRKAQPPPVEAPKFIPKRERQKAAAEAEQARIKAGLQDKPVVKPAAKTAKQPAAAQPKSAESKSAGQANAAPKVAPSAARRLAQPQMLASQAVQRKAPVATPAAAQPDVNALRAVKLAARRELGLQTSPPQSGGKAQAKQPQAAARFPRDTHSAAPNVSKDRDVSTAAAHIATAQQRVTSTAVPAVDAQKDVSSNATIGAQQGVTSTVNTQKPVLAKLTQKAISMTASDRASASEPDTPSCQSSDWTSQNESDMVTPRMHQSYQKHLRHQLEAKAAPLGSAASSPVTPNAIKAFQPECDDNDEEDVGSNSVTSPLSRHRLERQQSRDADDLLQDLLDGSEHNDIFFSDSSAEMDAQISSPDPEWLNASPCKDPLEFSAGELHMTAAEQAEAELQLQFLAAIAAAKAQACVRRYQLLGFSKQQSVVAVNKFGGDMQEGLAWLLTASDLHLQADCEMTLPRVDITEELQTLAHIQQQLHIPTSKLHQMGIDVQGSIYQVVTSMLQWANGPDFFHQAVVQSPDDHRHVSSTSVHVSSQAHAICETLGLSVLLPTDS